MAPFDLINFNYWYNQTRESIVSIHCLMPNGLCIQRQVPADTLLRDFKAELWREACSLPLFHLLRDAKYYVLSCVNKHGSIEELVDENRSIFDVQPFKPYFKVVEKHGDEAEKLINSKISMLIGKSIAEFDVMEKDDEVRAFRKKYRYVCQQICTERRRANWKLRAMYAYPPQFSETVEHPKYLEQHFKSELIVTVHVAKSILYDFKMPYNYSVDELIQDALARKHATMSMNQVENPDDYVLKIAGRNSFLFGQIEEGIEPKLLHFKYIHECIEDGRQPCLSLLPKSEVLVEDILPGPQVESDPPFVPEKSKKSTISLWDIGTESMVKIKVVCATNINASRMQIAVKCGIYHGDEPLCDIMSTSKKSGSDPSWNEFVEFKLPICDIPRMARMCFCICGYAANKSQPVPLSWVNVTMFDYNGILRSGSQRLHAFVCHGKDCIDSPLNPLGTVLSHSGQENGPCLLIEFTKFAEPVSYPPDDKIFELAAKEIEHGPGGNPLTVKGSKQHMASIDDIIKRDMLLPMFEQDKELLWVLRAECCNEYPDSLPKLLQSLHWNRREDVAQMYFFLQSWRKDRMSPEQGLELLNFNYPDEKVRKLAVELLDTLQDKDLELYLLQLVQVLKYESYLDCSLARFLLRRALNSRRLGHFLFWHLRSEMHNQQVSIRFGLMLEAYFRGSAGHIEGLTKQYEALKKLKTVTDLLKQSEDRLGLMRECLRKFNNQGAFSKLDSPLDPSQRLNGLRIDKCKYMNSAKKPLWLVFENEDELGEDIIIIFKNGDDLRQDVLTLQVLKIMDSIWKRAGQNHRMYIYNCLPTGDMVGLIEVVQKSQTVARIQLKLGGVTGVFRDDILFKWIKDLQPDQQKLDQMVENFRLSCSGYCVATYVLGIGDRHNDNIMMHEKSGQIFHIDFGHFLGNYKRKFGILRERVPFVLTADFLYIIRNGPKSREDTEVARFRQLCKNSFQELRHKGNLFMTLFTMMLNTGIPELQKAEDLEYLRNSLALSRTDVEAEKHFHEIFRLAYEKNRAASINFLVHNLKHGWIG